MDLRVLSLTRPARQRLAASNCTCRPKQGANQAANAPKRCSTARASGSVTHAIVESPDQLYKHEILERVVRKPESELYASRLENGFEGKVTTSKWAAIAKADNEEAPTNSAPSHKCILRFCPFGTHANTICRRRVGFTDNELQGAHQLTTGFDALKNRVGSVLFCHSGLHRLRHTQHPSLRRTGRALSLRCAHLCGHRRCLRQGRSAHGPSREGHHHRRCAGTRRGGSVKPIEDGKVPGRVVTAALKDDIELSRTGGSSPAIVDV